MRAYRLMPTPNRLRSMHIWLRHTHIWLMLTYIGLVPTPHRTYVYRTSDLRLSHIGLTSISHRTCAYPTSDLRLSHIGLAPTTHRTYAYPTSDLRLSHIQTCVCTHQTCVHPHENVQTDTNEPVPTSLHPLLTRPCILLTTIQKPVNQQHYATANSRSHPPAYIPHSTLRTRPPRRFLLCPEHGQTLC